MGEKNTINRITERFMCPGIVRDVKEMVGDDFVMLTKMYGSLNRYVMAILVVQNKFLVDLKARKRPLDNEK